MTNQQTTEGQRIPEPNSDAEAAMVQDYLEGMPQLNIGALLMPPIWGPPKGLWVTIVWYPLWVFADNCLFAWYSLGTPLTAVLGIITLVLLVAVSIAFARYSSVYAALKAVQKGKTKAEFQRTERIWAVVSIILAIAVLAFATYFNLNLRAPLVA